MPDIDLKRQYDILDQNRRASDLDRRTEAMARARMEANTITGMPNFTPGGSVADQALRARLQLIREREEADMIGAAISALNPDGTMGGVSGGSSGFTGATAPGGMSLPDALRDEELKARYKAAAKIANEEYQREIQRQKNLQPEPGFFDKYLRWPWTPPPKPGITDEKARGNAADNVQKGFPPGMLDFDRGYDAFIPKYPDVLPPGVLSPSVPAPAAPVSPGATAPPVSTRDQLINEVLRIMRERNEIMSRPSVPQRPTGYEPTDAERQWRERIGGEIMRRREQGPQGRMPYLWRSVPMNPRGGPPAVQPSVQPAVPSYYPSTPGAPGVRPDPQIPGYRPRTMPGDTVPGDSFRPSPGDTAPGAPGNFPRVTPGDVVDPDIPPPDLLPFEEGADRFIPTTPKEPPTPEINYPGKGSDAPARIQVVPPSRTRRGAIDPNTGKLKIER